MSHTLIAVRGVANIEDDSPIVARFEIPAPPGVPNGGMSADLDCDVAAGPFHGLTSGSIDDGEQIVLQSGAELWGRLTVHPAFVNAIATSVQAAAEDRPSPIRVEIDESAPHAELLPWETLYHPQEGFLGLENRLSIVRTARCAKEPKTWSLRGSLRIVAVLGAAGVSALDEWRSLRDALAELQSEYSLMVLTCEQDVYDEAAQADADRIGVDWIPSDGQALTNWLKDHKAHLIHFFAHGSSDHEGYLEVTDSVVHESGGVPIYLAADDLAIKLRGTWLITLNACQTGGATKATNSLAYELVAQGIAAAIGMRERVTPQTANAFTLTLYREVFRHLNEQLHQGEVALDWAEAMVKARAALCSATTPGPVKSTANRAKIWTLPALYMQVRPASARVLSHDSQLSDERVVQLSRSIADLRHHLGAIDQMGFPEHILANMRAMVEAEIAAREAEFST